MKTATNIHEKIRSLIENPTTTDICFSAQKLTYDSGSGLQFHESFETTEEHLKTWVLQELSKQQKSYDAKSPFVDLMIRNFDNTNQRVRMHVLFPPLHKEGILVSLRVQRSGAGKSAWRDDPLYPILKAAVLKKESVIIAGGTGSGKTTLLTTLLEEIPKNERLLALEDTPEIFPDHPNFYSLNSREKNAEGFGQITLRDLLKQTLRMRPDRILLGECRGEEVLDLLQSLNTGHSGALCTLHANGCREALKRLEVLATMGAPHFPMSLIQDLIQFGVKWLVYVERQGERAHDPQVPNASSRSRRIVDVAQLCGKEGSMYLLRQVK